MASSSSSHPPSPNTAHFIKLTDSNYLVWLRQIKPYLHGNKLWGYVDGTILAPPTTILSSPSTTSTPSTPSSVVQGVPPLPTRIPNPAYTQWFIEDQLTVSILTTTLTEPIAQLTIGFDTAKEIWDCLARHFSQKSVASSASLKMQLLDLQKGTQSIDDYLHHAKSIADALSAINKPVPDEDLVVATLHGLGPDYLMLRSALTQNPPLPDFTNLRARILEFDSQQTKAAIQSDATALFANSGNSSGPDIEIVIADDHHHQQQLSTVLAGTTASVLDNNEVNRVSKHRWWTKIMRYLKFPTDWVEETRGMLMVVAGMIVTMTFQVAVNPPGGVWQENNTNSTNWFGYRTCTESEICVAGSAVSAYGMNAYKFFWFMNFNTLSFFASLSVILLLISGFPLHNQLCMWLLSMGMCIVLSCLAISYIYMMSMIIPVKAFRQDLLIYDQALIAWISLLLMVGLVHTVHFFTWLVKWLCRRFRHKVSGVSHEHEH